MKSYLYIIYKNYQYDNVEEIKNTINALKNHKHNFFNFSHENIQCIAYTNEPNSTIDKDCLSSKYFCATSGQLAITNQQFHENIIKHEPKLIKNYIKNLSGAFSVSFVHFETLSVYAYTHFARVNPVYYFENSEKIVIGIDPIIVNCIGHGTTKPAFDYNNSVSFLVHGYFTDDKTLFEGVKVLPPNSELCVKNNEIMISQIDNSIERMFTKNPNKNDYDDLTHEFLKAYKVIPETRNPYRVGLTGGKDSRLIVLGLLENNVTFKSYTRGFDDHPDVIIAQRIANELGIEHDIINPVLNEKNQLEIDLINRIENVMIGTSGTVYGYENLTYTPMYKGNIGITGLGAEIIRGGYGHLSNIDNSNIKDELLTRLFPLKDYIKPDKQHSYHDFLVDFGENVETFKEAQFKHYIFYRTGRWTGGARLSNSYSSNVLSPFFDNNFLKKATQLNIDILTKELLHYNIMKRLNTEMVNVPYFASRWAFEKDGPINPNDFRKWFKRNPIYARTTIGAYNWRLLTNEDSSLSTEMKKIIIENKSSKIFDIVEYDKIMSLLNTSVPISFNKFIWSLVSIIVYTNYFNSKIKIPNNVITLTLPETKILSNDVNPSIRDITKLFIPMNRSVKTENNTEGTYLYINNHKLWKSNHYVQAGDNVFRKPPKKNKSILNVENAKNIFARICIEDNRLSCDYKMFVQFYNERSRIQFKSYSFNSKDKITYLQKKVPVPNEAKFVKIAIKFIPKKRDTQLCIKYGYLKVD